MKVAIKVVRGLRYKLRVVGVGVSMMGLTYSYEDYISVIHKTQRSESTLKKKSNSIYCHEIVEYKAIAEIITARIRTAEK